MRSFRMIAVLASLGSVPALAGPRSMPAPGPAQPAAVVEQANAYVKSLPPEESPKQKAWDRDPVRDFVRSFLDGFTNPSISMTGAPAGEAGYAAGQEYRKSNPGKIKETLESYGYVAMEAEGVWIRVVEANRFQPRGPHAKESWWITGEYEAADARLLADAALGTSVRITGYLSPPGMYGHMGMGDHQFFATKITRVSGK